MKHKLLLWKLYCLKNREQGFAISLAIMFGLLFILAATVLLGTSFKSESKQTANELSADSSAIALLALTKYKDLINNNPGMAAHPACGGVPDASGNCTSNDTSWSKPYSGSAPITQGLTKKIDSSYTVVNSDIPLCDHVNIIINGTGNPVDLSDPTNRYNNAQSNIIAAADMNWNNVSVSSGTAESKLIKYHYDSGNDEGTLIIESRVAGGSDITESVGTSVARYQVKIPVELKPPYGLWYHKNQESTINEAQIVSDVYDSTCAVDSADRTIVAGSINLAKAAQSEGSYMMTPEVRMLDLSDSTVVDRPSGSGSTDVTLPNPSPGLSTDPLRITPDDSDPSTTENINPVVTLTTGVYEFPGIEITDDKRLLISGGDEVHIVVTGDMVISGTARNAIEVAPNTKAIFYVDGSILVSGEAEIENNNYIDDEGLIHRLQIYAYGDYGVSGHRIELSDQSKINNVFLLGSNLPLVVSGTTQFRGTAWVRSFIDNSPSSPAGSFSYYGGTGFTTNAPLFVKQEPRSYDELHISTSLVSSFSSPGSVNEEDFSLKQLGDTPKSLERCKSDNTDECTAP